MATRLHPASLEKIEQPRCDTTWIHSNFSFSRNTWTRKNKQPAKADFFLSFSFHLQVYKFGYSLWVETTGY